MTARVDVKGDSETIALRVPAALVKMLNERRLRLLTVGYNQHEAGSAAYVRKLLVEDFARNSRTLATLG
jgi:hypothetical protein